jgi:hypothetical protein
VLVVEPVGGVRPADRQGVGAAADRRAVGDASPGKELVRAPAMPSNEIERTPSNLPTSTTSAITRGFSNVLPPSNERAIRKMLACLTVSSQATYTVPSLSVRTAHAWRPGWAFEL